MGVNRISWTEEYSVGNDELDRQHKKLFAIMNKLVDHHSLNVGSEEISDVINELMSYVKEHFSDEERILASLGYPELENHHKEHIQLTESLSEIMIAAISSDSRVPDELIRLLQGWISHHILDDDLAYGQFLKKRSGFTPD